MFLANYPEDVIDSLPDCLDTGVYYGWACLGGNEVYKMVLSIGWNPFFKNTKKSMVRLICEKNMIILLEMN